MTTFSNPTDPLAYPQYLSVNGMGLSYSSNVLLNVAAGTCADETGVNFITLASSVVISTGVNGVNGLDTGTVANNTLYAVYAIGSSYGTEASGCILSTSAVGPAMPFNYDMYRRIGYVLTDGAAHILPFVQSVQGNATLRTMWYDAQISVLSGGTSATFAAQSLAACVPAKATDVILNLALTPTGAGNTAALRPTGSSSTNGYVIISGAVSAVVQQEQVTVPCSAAASIDYKVTGALTILVSAYVDQL